MATRKQPRRAAAVNAAMSVIPCTRTGEQLTEMWLTAIDETLKEIEKEKKELAAKARKTRKDTKAAKIVQQRTNDIVRSVVETGKTMGAPLCTRFSSVFDALEQQERDSETKRKRVFQKSKK